MRNKTHHRKDANEVREDLLRPNRRLGYDRDSIGMHLLSCEAFEAAEALFRRAIWLNPFEPAFKRHLAWCLYRQKRFTASLSWIRKSLEQDPRSDEGRRIHELIRANLRERPGDTSREPAE